jgi:hypothetical protein
MRSSSIGAGLVLLAASAEAFTGPMGSTRFNLRNEAKNKVPSVLSLKATATHKGDAISRRAAAAVIASSFLALSGECAYMLVLNF